MSRCLHKDFRVPRLSIRSLSTRATIRSHSTARHRRSFACNSHGDLQNNGLDPKTIEESLSTLRTTAAEIFGSQNLNWPQPTPFAENCDIFSIDRRPGEAPEREPPDVVSMQPVAGLPRSTTVCSPFLGNGCRQQCKKEYLNDRSPFCNPSSHTITASDFRIGPLGQLTVPRHLFQYKRTSSPTEVAHGI